MNNPVFLVFLGLLAAVLSWVGVRLIRGYAIQRQQVLEAEGVTTETPRGGGLAVLVVVILIFMPVGLSLGDPSQVVRLALAGAMVAMIGFFDDLRTLPRAVRLAAQALAVMVFVPAAPVLQIGLPRNDVAISELVSYALSAIWIVGLSNTFNYMDNIDGLAGGQAVLAGSLWAIIGLVSDDMLVMLLGLLIAGASLGFLVYNLPPASIFLGEVGSTFLGFSLATLPILTVSRGGSSRLIISGVLIVGLFVFDAVLTFLRYLVRGQAKSYTLRSHLYQRLVNMGEPPYRVTLLYLFLSIGFGAAGLIYWRESSWIALAVCGLACLVLAVGIAHREAIHKAREGQVADR